MKRSGSRSETFRRRFRRSSGGEADVAFVNVVAAKKNHEKLGGMMPVKTGYEPITMTASIVKGAPNEKAAEQYLSCLTTPKAKAVLQKFGVGDAK